MQNHRYYFFFFYYSSRMLARAVDVLDTAAIMASFVSANENLKLNIDYDRAFSPASINIKRV